MDGQPSPNGSRRPTIVPSPGPRRGPGRFSDKGGFAGICFQKRAADRWARLLPRVRVAHPPRTRGYGGALRSGFAAATKDLVFYTDGDAQYDARELQLLYDALDDDVDMVNGYKISR